MDTTTQMTANTSITPKYVWLIFALIFTVFALYHFYRSSKSISKFNKVGGVKTIGGLSVGTSEFVDQFNIYIDELNKDNKRINIFTGIAYITTAATAFFSYFISP